MDDMDRSMRGVADGRERDLDLLLLVMFAGNRFSRPVCIRPLAPGRSCGRFESEAMLGILDDFS